MLVPRGNYEYGTPALAHLQLRLRMPVFRGVRVSAPPLFPGCLSAMSSGRAPRNVEGGDYNAAPRLGATLTRETGGI